MSYEDIVNQFKPLNAGSEYFEKIYTLANKTDTNLDDSVDGVLRTIIYLNE